MIFKLDRLDPNATLREIRNRNHFVFQRLFEDHYGDLVKYANEYLFDKDSSEDVVQEVFIQIWEKSYKIRIKTTLKAYLYTMVRNRCLNILKSIKITDTANFIELRTIFDSEYDFYPLSNDDKTIRYDLALKIVEALPSKMRTIVKLRFVNQYRYAQIADELGVSVNTVKTQLKRAKIKFGELTVAIVAILSFFG